jgi:hypothetical protein
VAVFEKYVVDVLGAGRINGELAPGPPKTEREFIAKNLTGAVAIGRKDDFSALP